MRDDARSLREKLQQSTQDVYIRHSKISPQKKRNKNHPLSQQEPHQSTKLIKNIESSFMYVLTQAKMRLKNSMTKPPHMGRKR